MCIRDSSLLPLPPSNSLPDRSAGVFGPADREGHSSQSAGVFDPAGQSRFYYLGLGVWPVSLTPLIPRLT
eukprot:3243481-Prorocentrum_lima.AAC.1